VKCVFLPQNAPNAFGGRAPPGPLTGLRGREKDGTRVRKGRGGKGGWRQNEILGVLVM